MGASKRREDKVQPVEKQGRRGVFHRLEQVIGTVFLSLCLLFLLVLVINWLRSAPDEPQEKREAIIAGPAPIALPVWLGEASEADARRVQVPWADDHRLEARFFAYESPTRGAIRFFIVERSDGTTLVAIDACVGCAQHQRGFSKIDGEMVCRWCGRSAPIELIGRVDHRCYPITVPFELTSGQLSIDPTDLERLDAESALRRASEP